MKKVLIIHPDMELGGAETSLIGLLGALRERGCEVDLFLYRQSGELLKSIPEGVALLNEKRQYRALNVSIKEALGLCFPIACVRLAVKLWTNIYRKKCDRTYWVKQLVHKHSLLFLPRFEGDYDVCLSFIDPHYIACRKVNAARTFGWLHTDFSRIGCKGERDKQMWDMLDVIVNVSESCKKAFDAVYPSLREKSYVIENILSERLVRERAGANIGCEMDKGAAKLLSIGRFCEAKNFDNVPDICMKIRRAGIDCVWYLIGYGGGEALIREKIKQAGAEDCVVLLGKKENPYAYIVRCDVYVQPSRYEGKSVTVREAQMLGKCPVITKYPTSAAQLTDGFDGYIVPMDNDGCADGIVKLINDTEKIRRAENNCRAGDYSNAQQADKITGVI
ncbi:MAG TPA: glycosyltransferase [Bacillota bacterium]|nr:glycosyltransferase [Bacillota bacterium]